MSSAHKRHEIARAAQARARGSVSTEVTDHDRKSTARPPQDPGDHVPGGEGAVAVAVAEDLSMRGDRPPQERHQDLAAVVLVLAPLSGQQRVGLLYPAQILRDQVALGAGEHLLPAQPIDVAARRRRAHQW